MKISEKSRTLAMIEVFAGGFRQEAAVAASAKTAAGVPMAPATVDSGQCWRR
jgi:hypothetical protein